MANRLVILTLLVLCDFMAGTSTPAQNSTDVCPSTGKLICTLPDEFGTKGLLQHIGPLTTGPGTGHNGGHFDSDFVSSLGSLNSAVGSQLTFLPIGSPGSGLVYVYDPTLKTFTASTEDLGPILTERASTTGRHKIRLGFIYQRFNFGALNGTSLHSLPASFTHIADASDNTAGVGSPAGGVPVTGCTTGGTSENLPTNQGLCGFVRDRIDTMTNMSLILNQYTATATFGLTRRIDVSLAIPIVNVSMSVNSTATIINNSNTLDHLFKPATCGSVTTCTSATFPTVSDNASGIGDIVLRAKGVVWSGERAVVSVAADLRLPTGDEQNFLGSGTIGFTPFVVASYSARVSPHVNLGYQVNGNSTLAGTLIPPVLNGDPPVATTPSTFTKAHLPNQFLYSGGVDVIILEKRLAGIFDVIGQRVFSPDHTAVINRQFLGKCGPPGLVPMDPTNANGYCTLPAANDSVPTLGEAIGGFNITSASLGAKLRITDKFIVFGNALIKLDNGGLRAKVVPLVGGSFSF